jgi:dihydrofolate reductase
MARLIIWNLMSLDGYFEGPNHDLSFHEDVWGPELQELSLEQLRAAGALLFGRLTYRLMADYWPTAEGEIGEIADFMNSLPKVVVSRTLKKSDWGNTRIVGENAAEQVAKLKRDTEKDIYVFGSANLSATLIAAKLFDEFRIGLAPRLLGGGTPLFKPGERRKLRLIEASPHANGLVRLRYAPV